MTPQLIARDLTFAYPDAPDRPVLAGVSLAVGPGDRLGVVGENGSGKSTLLALLAGRLAPTAGEVVRHGRLAVVEQEFDGVAPVGTDACPPHVAGTLGDLVASALATARAAATELENRISALSAQAVANADPANEGGAEKDRRDPVAELALAVERYEATRAWDADRVLDEALTRFGVPREADRELATLSVGARYRARLACRLAEASDLLLLDEPTNHLDASAMDHLTRLVRSWPGAVVVVTHDRRLLDDVATAILDLDPTIDGAPARFGATGRGPERAFSYAGYRAQKDAALARWRSRYRREQQRLADLFTERDRAYENLSDEWRPPKGSQGHRRATRARQHVKNADRQHDRLSRAAVSVPPPPPELALPVLPGAPLTVAALTGEPLLALRGAVVPGRLDLPDLAVALERGDRLLVTGANGTGKSTLLGLLALAGGPEVRIGHLAQEPAFGPNEGASGEQIATERIVAALEARGLDPDQVVPLLATGLVAEDALDAPVSRLSVGQRRRLDLALTLMVAPHVLVLDEPTNHLAVDVMDELTGWLVGTAATVVVATHDRRMLADLGPDGAGWPVLDLT